MFKRTFKERSAGAAFLPLVAAVSALLAVPPASWGRAWKPDAQALARDYAIITDGRNSRDINVIFWLNSAMVPPGAARQILETYVIVGVAHTHMDVGGAMSHETTDTLDVADGSGAKLRLLRNDDMPPTVKGIVTTVTGMFGQSLGAFGKGMQWFVFESGSVRTCEKGGLAVSFANEVYTYETPIPGCSVP